MKVLDLVQQMVQKPEERKVAIMYVDNWVYVYEDDLVVEDMIHSWEHIVVITKKRKDIQKEI